MAFIRKKKSLTKSYNLKPVVHAVFASLKKGMFGDWMRQGFIGDDRLLGILFGTAFSRGNEIASGN